MPAFYGSPWGNTGVPGAFGNSTDIGQMLLQQRIMAQQRELQMRALAMQQRELDLKEQDSALRAASERQRMGDITKATGIAGDVGQAMTLGNVLSQNASGLPQSVQQPTLQQAFSLLQKQGLWQPPQGGGDQFMPQETLRALLNSIGQGGAANLTAQSAPGQLLQRDFARPGEAVLNKFSTRPELTMPPAQPRTVPPRATIVPRGGIGILPSGERVENPYTGIENRPPGALLNYATRAIEFPDEVSPENRALLGQAVQYVLQSYIAQGQKPTPPAHVTAAQQAQELGPLPKFETEEEALASGVTGEVIIGGRRARIDY